MIMSRMSSPHWKDGIGDFKAFLNVRLSYDRTNYLLFELTKEPKTPVRLINGAFIMKLMQEKNETFSLSLRFVLLVRSEWHWDHRFPFS